MRLINTLKFIQERRIHFEEFYDSEIPDYAILSHTWERNQEVTYEDCNSDESKAKSGFIKICETCDLAVHHSFNYVWVDTCCIDKSSSAELSEAINSMFKWYQRAGICFAYLSDLEDVDRLKDCRWFTRGWTLQELIAPINMLFFDKDWVKVGDKKKPGWLSLLSFITKIPDEVLAHEAQLASFSVARRLSWAAGRKTTRVEDIAYCLLGMFDINMPMLYGEGEKAFYRLQEEIINSIYDLSILAWSPPDSMEGDFCGCFAMHPDNFSSCLDWPNSATWSLVEEGQMTVTSKGVVVQVRGEDIAQWPNGRDQYVLKLVVLNSSSSIALPLRKIGPHTFIRSRDIEGRNSLKPIVSHSTWALFQVRPLTLLTKLPDAYLRSRIQCSNIVSFSRRTTVRIEWPESLRGAHHLISPSKCWDAEDAVSFATPNSLENWAAQMKDALVFVCFWHESGSEWILRGHIMSLQQMTPTDQEGMRDKLFHFAERFNYSMDEVLTIMKGLDLESETSAMLNYDGKVSEFSFTVECELDSPRDGAYWTVQIHERVLE